jgi:Transketolase, N-terminal subunit
MELSIDRQRELEALCLRFRREVLTAIHKAQSGHPGGSLSVCEILTLLYQHRMHISSPDDPERDRLVLCKGHAAPMLYRNLIEKGFLPADCMDTLRQLGSSLQGHPSIHTPGVDMPSGPLGIGLAAAQGMALGLRMNGSKARVYAVLGDGELDEGAVWEAADSAPKFRLDNLCAVVDYNKVQLDGTIDEIMPLRDLEAKWRDFGWHVIRCDGHDLRALNKAFDGAEAFKGGPTVIIADTVKGKGVSFMEGQAGWHGKAIDDANYEKAMTELGGVN